MIGSLTALVLLLIVLENAGVRAETITIALVLFIVAMIVALGLIARTVRAPAFFAANTNVHSVYNGMVLAGTGVSVAIVFGLAGDIFASGFDGALPALGVFAGFALLTIFLASAYRRAGATSVPDFLAKRFDSLSVRVLASLLVFTCSAALLIVQIAIGSAVAANILAIELETAIVFAAVLLAICTIPGGLRGATWTQIIQFLVLMIAVLTPAVWIAFRETGIPVPYIATTTLSAMIENAEASNLANGLGQAGVAAPLAEPLDRFNRIAIVATLACGVAAMPHILMRAGTAPTPSAARWSGFWGLILIGLVLATAPVYVFYTQLEVTRSLPGLMVGDLIRDANWVFDAARWTGEPLIALCGQAILTPDDAFAACGGVGHVLAASDIAVDPTALTLALPTIAGLPTVTSVLLFSGVLAAALATASALLMAIVISLSHDIHVRLIDRHATANRRLLIARFMLASLIIAAVAVARDQPATAQTIAQWAIPIAAAGLFPALVLGAFWPGATAFGAICGMLAGSLSTTLYLWGTSFGIGGDPWTPLVIPGLTQVGIMPLASGLIGLSLGFLTIIGVSTVRLTRLTSTDSVPDS